MAKTKNSLFIVAEENNKMVGYLYGYVEPLAPFKIKSGYLDDMIVSKRFRGKGVGTKLHNEFIKWLREKKIKWAVLHVDWVNKMARKTYEKWEYKNKQLKMVKRLR